MSDEIGGGGGIKGPCFGGQSVTGYVFEISCRYNLQEFGLRISFRGGGLSGCLFDDFDVFLLFWR